MIANIYIFFLKCKTKVPFSGLKYIHDFIPKEKTYINGKWISSKDNKVFSVSIKSYQKHFVYFYSKYL